MNPANNHSSLSRINRPYYRNGEDHRSGADVSFADIIKYFGFRAVDIGKWVTQEEQQIAANLFFDAFCDLMDILRVPKQVISLNGSLALAFGTGGQKFSCAHYDSSRRRLALAKNAGGGALAHEWFHAFDHYICERMFAEKKAHQFASQAWLDDTPIIEHPLNQRLADCMQLVFLDENHQANDYVRQSIKADQALQSYYYARPQELAARAFEAIVQDQPIKNAFLVQGTKQSAEASIGIYPSNKHKVALSHAFFQYFVVLGQAVAQKSEN